VVSRRALLELVLGQIQILNREVDMRKFLCVFIAMLIGFIILADDKGGLAVTIKTDQVEVIMGETFESEVVWENKGQTDIKIPFTLAYLNPYYRLTIKGTGYEPKCCLICGERALEVPGVTIMKPGEVKQWKEDIVAKGAVKEGEYEVWAEFDSFSKEKETYKIKAESNHIYFRVIRPKGIDLEVFEKFHNACNQITLKPSELLLKYPTSTYAAYAIYQSSGARGIMASEPINIAKAIDEGAIWYPQSVPDDTGKWKGGWQSLTAENYVKWRDKWFDIVLKNHPDIWFADALRLRKAVEDYSHKRTESLLTDIETLSKTGSPDVAKKAQEILAALKSIEGEKKKEIETGAPKAVPTPQNAK
jgi:hypothetical protein